MTAIAPENRLTPSPFVLLERGFRPFFLLAGIYAAFGIGSWLGIWQGWIALSSTWPAAAWHAHEMIFGFATAALAGFLLTAVPTWTGSGPVRGVRLASLVLAWIAGRVTALAGVDARVFAAVDLAFIPLLLLFVAPGIVQRNLKRNGIVLVLLGILLASNAGTHLAALEVSWVPPRWGSELGLALMILLIAIIGGRIIPPFTVGGMRMAGRALRIDPTPWIDRMATSMTALWALSIGAGAGDVVIGAAAALAAFAHAARLSCWTSWRTWRVPLVWVLHLGYAWLVFGLAASAAARLAEVWPLAAGFHALGAGAVGTMTLAVMSRASLGHTGRTLAADAPTTFAYALVTLGTVARVTASLVSGELIVPLILTSGVLWASGFVLFCIVYAPILTRPRVDGRPG
jgi:uncharacterized protein involved in response to NO